jgi:leucyl aminopeptidase
VGKGLTFDSGGYNLKVGGAQIDMMKFDMGGSASVLGAMRSIGELKPAGVEVHMVVASCENMVNGSAVHPGDIVTAANGTTIEINNTDAEGRLTLADALLYACEQKPDAVVDLATLTGACVVALGDEMAGYWSNNEALAEALDTAADAGGEGLWRMPLRQSYKKGLKSLLADMKNTGPRPGGSITAALFLKEFVSQDTAWAHIDIAGPVWSDKGKGVNPAGATGYGVRTLVNWVCAQGMSSSPIRWYLKAQLGVLLLPVGLCLFGEAVSRKVVQMLGQDGGPWFWYGTLSLICINAGIGLMVESGLTRGFPGRKRT